MQTISQKASTSHGQVEQNQHLLADIQQIGEQVNNINAQVADNAQHTFSAMEQSLGFAQSMLSASSDKTYKSCLRGLKALGKLLK